jgi:chemotaxis protein histidine kinase CheA
MVPSWGEQLGKRVCLHVRGEQVAIPAALHQVLGGIVSHLLRNAVAHGIEVPEVRETRGKSIIGVVGLEAVEGDQGPILRVFDDGIGVEHPAPFGAREASQAGESYVAESTLDGTMFFSQERRGPSHGNEFSGRGVGLAAVRSELETVGYKIRMTSRYQRFTLFEMVPQGLQWPTLVEDVVAAVDGREQ